ncbi:hypothetical protein CDAR_457151 [Caerostris darwini]|uniref:Uncharacterized protein n=1 Tax=Caerostris darwini TaxID=1538125 RepID=A0AAV4PAP0_9ARAC|nr:hypothetical protein CDAR_457151 [Caerostris darwini]
MEMEEDKPLTSYYSENATNQSDNFSYNSFFKKKQSYDTTSESCDDESKANTSASSHSSCQTADKYGCENDSDEKELRQKVFDETINELEIRPSNHDDPIIPEYIRIAVVRLFAKSHTDKYIHWKQALAKPKLFCI